ncbi:hypothetical protein GA417_05570 [Poseidonibacter ostreae]|uniref:hypothetical protein n=1 Tax=Poseidonibacter ostreae TaxID=2654171 RepID=UPI0012657647|nr:hypothetical protein [Poseidonibacter ostreae]KAB7886419.1 hypothetical protein GA417_05570 [Poseidonibacter ostreae]
MNKLRQEDNNYHIENSKSFQTGNTFKDETIEKVFEFAYAMTFGDGEHRDHRSGGNIKRKKGQIFINTFQGKLSELAVYLEFFKYNKPAYDKLSKPDFDVYGLGEWDDSDIILDGIKFSIKSTKFYGNLLLLETKDWNNKGEYLPNLNTTKNSIYDYFVLVRMKPDGEKLMISKRFLYSNEIDKEELYSLIKSVNWEYDVPGYITNDDLKTLINNDLILPQRSMLNGKIPMDAENYYIQSGDMRDFQQLVSSL